MVGQFLGSLKASAIGQKLHDACCAEGGVEKTDEKPEDIGRLGFPSGECSSCPFAWL